MLSAAPHERHALEQLEQLSLLESAAGAAQLAQEIPNFQQGLRVWLQHG